ncbi:MAG: hypothetical protein HYX49_02800 [Chloroflexi bacterium]|nr:hypothetical protein [Chloroflexota bacterium]
MNTKKNNVVTVLTISLLVVITIASISFYFSRPQAVASASSAPTQQILPTVSVQIAAPQTNIPEVLTAAQNDVTVNVTSAKVIDTGIEIGICYTTLDNGEWYPMPGPITYGKYKVAPKELGFLDNEIPADGKNTGTRCAFVRYNIDDLTTITTPISFSILKFYAPPREMYTPCQEVQQRLNTNPKAQAHSLKIKCSEKADGNRDVTLVGNDNSITSDEAQKELDVIANAEVQGNWTFTITDLTK